MRRRLEVESLESRLVPSAAPVAPPGLGAGPLARAAAHPAAPLAGAITGRFTILAGNPDVGIRDSLTGSGTLAGVGQVSADGILRRVGFAATGHAVGTLTLMNEHGTVALHLTGPKQKGFAPLPAHFRYAVTGGTGAYAHLTGRGQATLVLVPAGTDGGTFTLTFHPTMAA
jgi:hypothetical protein